MSLFFQLLENGIVQGAVAMLYAAGFGFVYGALMLSALFAAAIEWAVYHPENFPNVSGCRNPIIDLPPESIWDDVSRQRQI